MGDRIEFGIIRRLGNSIEYLERSEELLWVSFFGFQKLIRSGCDEYEVLDMCVIGNFVCFILCGFFRQGQIGIRNKMRFLSMLEKNKYVNVIDYF